MAMIEVDRSTILSTAQAVDRYCELQKAKMRSMDTEVKAILRSDWVGDDASAFLLQWEGVDSEDSAAIRLQKAMEHYAESLRACAEAYRVAQQDLYNQTWLLW